MSATEIEEAETERTIIGVDELQNYGINASDLQKLRSGGIYTVNVSYSFPLLTKYKYRITNISN